MRRRKLNKTILFILIFGISIGFAYLSTQLNINGGASVRGNTWDIHFEDVQVVESVEGNPTPTISSDKKSVDYVANLNEPGDVFSFNVDVVNAGTLDGMIESITNDGLTTEQQKLVNVEYKYSNGDPFEEHFVILNGNRKTINVRVEYKYDIEEEDLPTELTSINLTFSITYQQATEDAYTSTTFIDGPYVNEQMYNLLGNSSNDDLSNEVKSIDPSFLNHVESPKIKKLTTNEPYISSFMRSFDLPSNLSDDNIISTDDSDVPIYMWVKFDQNEEGKGSIYWYSDADVVFLNENSSNFFRTDSNPGLTDISGLSNVDVSKTTDISDMFYNCRLLEDISPLINWNVSNVKNMISTFAFTGISDISSLKNWDVSSVEDMNEMFYLCESLTSISDLSEWDMKSLTRFGYIFGNCYNLTDISGVSNWKFDNVEYVSNLFAGCQSLTDISPLANWDVSHAISIEGMFSDCYSLSNISYISDWDVSKVLSLKYLFFDCRSLTSLSALNNWNVSKVKRIDNMCRACSKLTTLNGLDNWNVGKVTNMSEAFESCVVLNDISALSNWNVSSVVNMSYMFENCKVLSDLIPLLKWNVSNVINFKNIFDSCQSIVSLNGLNNWNVRKGNDMSRMFNNCKSLNDITALTNWKLDSVTSIVGMFYFCSQLSNASSIFGWNIPSSVSQDYAFKLSGLISSTKPPWYTGTLT